MPDAPMFYVLALVFVVVHVLATLRRRWYFPFCYWPMFSSPPSLPRSEAYRLRLHTADRVQWWRPRYPYRGRNYSHRVHIMLGRVRVGELPFARVARPMVRNAVALIRSDCPDLAFADITRIEIVRMTATLDDDGRSFVETEQVVLGFDGPARGSEVAR